MSSNKLIPTVICLKGKKVVTKPNVSNYEKCLPSYNVILQKVKYLANYITYDRITLTFFYN